MSIRNRIKNNTVWYRNCKRQRKNKAKICTDCPFRKIIIHIEGELNDKKNIRIKN